MKILCIGRTLVDVVVKGQPVIPVRHSARVASEIKLRAGGGALYTARVLKLLGHDVFAYGYAGNDIEGWLLQQFLLGVNFETCIPLSKDFLTTVNIVFVDDEGRARYLMGNEDPSSSFNIELPRPSDVDANIVHISTINQLIGDKDHPLLSWLGKLRSERPDIIVSADASKLIKHCSKNILLLKGELDFLFGSRVELQMLADQLSTGLSHRRNDVYEVLRSIGAEIHCKCVISTLSSQGSVALMPDGEIIQTKGFFVEKPRDSNGAGDTFCAAFLHCHIGMDMTIEESLHFANYLAARHVEGSLEAYDCSEPIDQIYHQRRTISLPVDETLFYEKSQGMHGYGERFDKTRKIDPRYMEKWISRFKEFGRINESTLVLDAGCGTGRFSIPLIASTNCDVVGVDLSREMLRVAKEKHQQLPGTKGRADWVLGDLLHLSEMMPEKMGEFDCVLLSSVIDQLGEKLPDVLQQIYTALEDTGRLIMRVRCKELVDHIWWYDYFLRAKETAFEKFKPLSTIVSFISNADFDIVHLEKIIDQRLSKIDELIAKFRAGGFSWCFLYSENELAEILAEIAKSEKSLIAECNPCYFIVAEKHRLSGGSLSPRFTRRK